MIFYELWDSAKTNKIDESSFLYDFLRETDLSTEVIYNGTSDDILMFVSILLSTPSDLFIEKIEENFHEISPETIMQFSTFEHAVFSINKLIHFSNGKMTFSQLGREIMHSREEGACKKYGENHSKLAAMLGSVVLEREGSFVVKNSNFGEFSVSMSKEDKIEIIKRLALRNPFIQKIISDAKNGNCDYMVLAQQYLSESTALRRRSNVRYIVSLVLSGTKYEYLNKNIVW